jgi:hypothetical protein
MSKSGKLLVLALLLGAAALLAWRLFPPRTYPVFAGARAGCDIVVPRDATKEEMTAAQLLSDTLAAAAGRTSTSFPVRRESRWRFWQEGVFVGETRRAPELPLPGATRLERPVGIGVFPTGVVLRSRWREDVVGAASWFLEKHLGARWFMPGPLGVSVPRRAALRLERGIEVFTPSFVSRSLGDDGANGVERWAAANRLRAIFRHNHGMSDLFKPEDVVRMPELAPLVNWQKYSPTRPNEQEWQPNIAADSAARHAAGVLRRRFNEDPGLLSVSIAMNDSIRYDQSPATQGLVGGPRFFRQKPDFSNLVFGFANQVARELAPEFPDRFITTYAYDWTEDVPRFAVEPNVVPYLTADRSQWFDPAFAAQDQDLIRRWVAAGPKVVGIYDYYEGAPFLVPRPTLYAVAQSIPFAHAAGVRAFYAEAFTNWGLDGPKCWLAAQLLWDAQQDPAALLDIYYREFWQEAAAPLREYFALCDRQWLEQPLPSYWLKYFKDGHQARLFPKEVRARLRALLTTAERLARTETVRQRVRFFSASLAITEAFGEFSEARTALSRLTLPARPDPAAVIEAAALVTRTRRLLETSVNYLREKQPLGIRAKLLEEYTRNDPRRRALWRLWPDLDNVSRLPGFPAAFADLQPMLAARRTPGRDLIVDGALTRLQLRDIHDFTSLDWVKSGYWRGHGEPYETRQITIEKPDGTANAIRFSGCKQETLSQWHAAEPETDYIGTVKVRAKVSPGNMTFLIITFLNEKGEYIGIGSTDRVPVGEWNEAVELSVFVHAPKNVRQIGLGVRVLNQVNDDYADFSELSLKRMGE